MKTYVYARRGERDLALDVFAPENSNRGAILLLHGGAFLVGARENMHAYAQALARLGFTAIPVSYSLRTEVLWPAPLDDVKAAFAWVKAHAGELGVDPDKIAFEGFSAGSLLSLLAAREVGAAAVVVFFPPVHPFRDPQRAALLGDHLTPSELDAYSGIAAVQPGYPPTLILHGTADSLVPVDEALALFAKLRQVGSKADLRIYHDCEHEFCVEPSLLEPLQRDVAFFLDRAMIAPARYAEETRTTNPFRVAGPAFTLPAPLRRT